MTLSRDRTVDAPAERVWALITDWPRHSEWIPLTTVTTTGGGPGEGTRFVGRTGLGPLAADDPMEITRWQPPGPGSAGVCEVLKHGRVVHGRAVLEVHPLAGRRCRVVWTYHDLRVSPTALTRLAEPLLRPVTGAGVDRLLAQVAERAERDERDGA